MTSLTNTSAALIGQTMSRGPRWHGKQKARCSMLSAKISGFLHEFNAKKKYTSPPHDKKSCKRASLFKIQHYRLEILFTDAEKASGACASSLALHCSCQELALLVWIESNRVSTVSDTGTICFAKKIFVLLKSDCASPENLENGTYILA